MRATKYLENYKVYIVDDKYIAIYLGSNKFYVLYSCADVLKFKENQFKNIDIIVKSALLISAVKSNIIELDNIVAYYEINVSKTDTELWLLKNKLLGLDI